MIFADRLASRTRYEYDLGMEIEPGKRSVQSRQGADPKCIGVSAIVLLSHP
jgi:hypothetical protein